MSMTGTDIIQISLQLARRLRQSGWDIIDCGRSNPSHPASSEAITAMQAVIHEQALASSERGESIQYGATGGEEVHRAQIASSLSRDYGGRVHFLADHVMCVHGGKAAILAVFMAVRMISEACTVLVQSPGYLYYRRLLARAWDSFRLDFHEWRCDASRKFRPDLANLADTLERGRRRGNRHALVVLSDPCNPTGVKLTSEELEEFANICRQEIQRGTLLWIMLDESFHAMVFPSRRRTWLLEVAPDMLEHVVLLRSGTKDMGMAADRLAAIGVPPTLLAGVRAYLTDTGLTAAPVHQAGFAAGLASMTSATTLRIGSYYEDRALAFRQVLEQSSVLSSATFASDGTFFVPVWLEALRNLAIPPEVAIAMADFGHRVSETAGDDLELMCAIMGGGAVLSHRGIAVVPMSNGALDSGWFRVCVNGPIGEVEEAAKRLVAMAEACSPAS